MQKNTIKILITALFLIPLISWSYYSTSPNLPNGYTLCSTEGVHCSFAGSKDVAYGANNVFKYQYNIAGGIDCNNNMFGGDPAPYVLKSCYIKDTATSAKENFFVQTNEATNLGETSATLNGVGGYKTSSSTLSPLTAYFRYSKADISPIYCNDIYGTNMGSTGDLKLTKINSSTLSQTFSQKITGLSPNTTYYYCAIISNKEGIAYGGTSIIKKFHTDCYTTTVNTSGSTMITSDSAKITGNYCSTKTVTTSFEYKEAENTTTAPTVWKEVGKTTYDIGKFSNLYGNISFNLSGLNPKTIYQFRAVAKNNLGKSNETIFTGSALDFTTNYNETLGGGNDGSSDTTGDNNNGNNENNNQNNNNGNSDNQNNINNQNNFNGNNYGNNNNGNTNTSTGIIDTTPLKLGQTITPPGDAVVHYHEGIETVFVRQITADTAFAKLYGYGEGDNLQNFAWGLADTFARDFGYVNSKGKEIRVSKPDVAAYQLQLSGNKLTVYEYFNGKIIDVRDTSADLKNASAYEYYFKK